MAAVLRAALFAIGLAACGGAAPSVSLAEMQPGLVEGQRVGVGPIFQRAEFRKGKRTTIRWATLYLPDRVNQTVQKQDVAEGDDLYIGRGRWTVKEIVVGTGTTRGGVVLERVEE